MIGTHWIGVFYQEGSGVTKNLDRAIELLTRAAKLGNAQSNYQLFHLYSSVEEKKNPALAYKNLVKAVSMGVTFFDVLNQFFKDHYDVLAEDFVKSRKLDFAGEKKENVINLHEAFVNELRTNFMAALGKDRMYKRPCGSVTDQQIWMIGVLVKYLLTQVLHFSHTDFMTAVRVDLGPLLGDTGLWALKTYQDRQAEKGNDDKKKRARTAIDLITKYLESGFDVLGNEKKYHSSNRFSPKKLPEK